MHIPVMRGPHGITPRMKSLGEFHSSTECSQIRGLLNSCGIPTYWNPAYGGASAPLFVCIDEQYDDALALLKDPEHVVAHPVDIEEFKQAEQSQGLGSLFVGAGAILLALLGIVGAMVVIRMHQ